jgi:membrane protease YdiL (CAAX protease family)
MSAFRGDGMSKMNRKLIAIISPFLVILLGFICSKLLSTYINEWAFVPVMIIYWTITVFIVYKSIGINKIKEYFIKPIGNRLWLILAIIIGVMPVAVLMQNLSIITSPFLIGLCILVAIINSFFEEIYWRGYILEYSFKSKFIATIFSMLLFAASHLVIWGVFSFPNSNWFMPSSLIGIGIEWSIMMGIVWSILKFKTKSLWWCVISHFLVDLFNLSVFTVLNPFILPAGQMF